MALRTTPGPLGRVHLPPGCHAETNSEVAEALKWSVGRCGSVPPLTWSWSRHRSSHSSDHTATCLRRAARAMHRRFPHELLAPPPPARAKLHHHLASRHTVDRQLRPRNSTTVYSASTAMTLGCSMSLSKFPRPRVRIAATVYLQKSAAEHLIADSLLQLSSSPTDTTPRSLPVPCCSPVPPTTLSITGWLPHRRVPPPAAVTIERILWWAPPPWCTSNKFPVSLCSSSRHPDHPRHRPLPDFGQRRCPAPWGQGPLLLSARGLKAVVACPI
jgi:hypothetical protein